MYIKSPRRIQVPSSISDEESTFSQKYSRRDRGEIGNILSEIKERIN